MHLQCGICSILVTRELPPSKSSQPQAKAGIGSIKHRRDRGISLKWLFPFSDPIFSPEVPGRQHLTSLWPRLGHMAALSWKRGWKGEFPAKMRESAIFEFDSLAKWQNTAPSLTVLTTSWSFCWTPPGANHQAKTFTLKISSESQNRPTRWVLLSCPFYRWENPGSKKL